MHPDLYHFQFHGSNATPIKPHRFNFAREPVTPGDTAIGLIHRLHPATMLPRPTATDLKFEGKAQERADPDDQGKHGQILKGRRNGNRSDNIPSNKQLQPKENGATQILTVGGVTVEVGRCRKKEGSYGGDQNAANDSQNTYAIDYDAHFFNHSLECFHEKCLYHVWFYQDDQIIEENHQSRVNDSPALFDPVATLRFCWQW